MISPIPVGFSYYPLGVFLAYILYSFNLPNGVYFFIQVWPLIIAMFGALLTAVALGLSKAFAKRIVWVHFYAMAIGTIFLFAAGLLLMLNWGESRIPSMAKINNHAFR